jgi:hypothetical protein
LDTGRHARVLDFFVDLVARYWNQDVDLSPRLTGSLTVDLQN